MSMTKRSPHFDAMLEEQRRLDDTSYDAYLSEMYFLRRELADTDPGDEQVTTPNGTKQQHDANDN